MISIKNRFTNATICEFEVETIKEAAEKGKADLRKADLCKADLYGANLRGADLCKANLCGADLYEANLRGADLREANLRGADLYEADLRGADLRGADLYEANLCGADLCGSIIDGEKITKTPIQIPCGLRYIALVTDSYMRLGCKRYTHSEWAAFSDAQISKMDSHALEFWKQWKEPLLAICKAHAVNAMGDE